MKERLTDKDRETLARAAQLRRRFQAGIFPRGGGQRAHFAKLERLGMLRLVGWGRDIDGETADVMIYELTDAGAAAAESS